MMKAEHFAVIYICVRHTVNIILQVLTEGDQLLVPIAFVGQYMQRKYLKVLGNQSSGAKRTNLFSQAVKTHIIFSWFSQSPVKDRRLKTNTELGKERLFV